jgi:hypothetical protein
MKGKITRGLLINPSEIGNVQIFEGDGNKSKLRFYFHHNYNFQNNSKRLLRVVLLYIIIIIIIIIIIAAKATYYYYYYYYHHDHNLKPKMIMNTQEANKLMVKSSKNCNYVRKSDAHFQYAKFLRSCVL